MATSGSTRPTPPRQPMKACGDCGTQNEASRTRCISCQAQLSIAEVGPTSPFDAIKRTDERGEHWAARDLMRLLGYTKWERFEDAIQRAMVSIANSGGDPEVHASRLREASGKTERSNYRLTRYGAYMAAMNGDVRKPEIAAAQTYFAIRTHEAELANSAPVLDEIEVAERYVASLRREKALAIENAKLKIKADAFDLWINGKGVYLVGTVAKMRGINLGPKTLWDFLYAEKLLIKAPGTKRHREPYARPDTENWFDVNPVPPERTNGHATSTTCITAYGAEQIRLLLIKRGIIPSEQLALISGGQDSLFGEAI